MLGRSVKLPFYKNFDLVQVSVVATDSKSQPVSMFALVSDKDLLVLDGKAGAVYGANQIEGLKLRREEALEYLRFFCFAVRGDGGAFFLF